MQTFRKLISSFFQCFGVLALFLGVFDVFFPNLLHLGYKGVGITSLVSLVWSARSIWPRREIRRHLSVPDTCVTVKVGDLFQQETNLVVGMNDAFDTEKGDIIKPSSIQGQFLTKVYHDDQPRLDAEIQAALQGIPGKPDRRKTRGKNIRYPIGTVATLTVRQRKYFCSAYSYMGIDLKTQSDMKKLTLSLDKLWEEIRVKGQGEKVAIAVIGSDLARLGNTVSHSDLIKHIISSFIFTSREKWIIQELIIVIHPSKFQKVNMAELADFLQSF